MQGPPHASMWVLHGCAWAGLMARATPPCRDPPMHACRDPPVLWTRLSLQGLDTCLDDFNLGHLASRGTAGDRVRDRVRVRVKSILNVSRGS